MARKYFVFWGIVFLAVVLLSVVILFPRAQQAVIEEQASSAKELFAQELESRYSQIDVVNIRTYVDVDGNVILGLYFDVLSPLSSDQLEVMILDILQGLDGLADGTEDNYVIDYLYGHWQVGRTTCPARYLADVQSGLEVCSYSDIDPPEYGGRLVIWKGRAP